MVMSNERGRLKDRSDHDAAERITHEASSRRRHIRIQLPLDVKIDGKTYRSRDWSLEGAGLEGIETNLKLGDRFQAELIVPLHGFNFTIDVTCELMWYRMRESRLGCRFVDLNESQVELLHYLKDAYISGRIVTADGLLTVAQPGPASACQHTDVSKPPRGERFWRAASRALRYILLLLVGAGLFSTMGITIYGRFFTIDAELAAVSAPTMDIRNPRDGTLVGPRLVPGSVTRTGTVLFKVENDALKGELHLATAALEREKTALESLQEQLDERRAFFTEYRVLAGAERQRAQAAYERSSAALDIAERQLKRAAHLHAQGVLSARELDEAELAKGRAQLDLRLAKANLVEAESNAHMAHQGYYFTGTRVEGGEPGDIQRRVRLAEKSVELAQARVDLLRQRIDESVVRSPCECVVDAVFASPNEWVKAGDVVYVLRDLDPRETVIEALLPQEEAHKVTVGSLAYVRLADSETILEGRIVAVNREGQRLKRTGLPDHMRNDPKYATVQVSIPDALSNMSIGLPAKVKFPSTLRAALFDTLGWKKDAGLARAPN